MSADPSDQATSAVQARPRFEVPIEDVRVIAAVGELARTVRDRGGRVLVVGGSVRDALWDERHGTRTQIKDVDLEVFGIPAEELRSMVLAAHPRTKLVGAAFGVLTVEELALDISLPRRERQVGQGHTDFIVDADPTMSSAQAAARRDFTINAISWDPLTGEVVDPVRGEADLGAGVLRHVGPQFAEDPLRVLRGAQFIARFGLTADPATEVLCASLLPAAASLSSERVWDEVGKLLLKGVRPGAGLRFLERVGWTAVASPQLAALVGVEQDPVWHPEGDVFTHTCHVLDFWSEHLRTGDPYEDLVIALAAWAHDFGKASTTAFVDGRWRAHDHEAAGIAPTREWLADAQFPLVDGMRRDRLTDEVTVLVASHLAPVTLHKQQSGDKAIRRLAQKVGRIDRLVRLAHADQGGRPPLDNREFPAGEWLLARASELHVVDAPPHGLLRGQDLIDELGLVPGPEFKRLLAAALAAQIDGEVSTRDEALVLVRTLLDR
jgi:tRNA nucleotidyltransferase (CCA-adding enzyme)